MSSLAIVDLHRVQHEMQFFTNAQGHIAQSLCFSDVMGFIAWLANQRTTNEDVAYEIEMMVWEEHGEGAMAAEMEALLHRCWICLGDTLCEAVGNTGQYAIWDGYEDEESGRFKIEQIIM